MDKCNRATEVHVCHWRWLGEPSAQAGTVVVLQPTHLSLNSQPALEVSIGKVSGEARNPVGLENSFLEVHLVSYIQILLFSPFVSPENGSCLWL